VEILVEKVTRDKYPAVWLFASKTLDSVPQLFADVDTFSLEQILPGFLAKSHAARSVLLY
jgi:hypothetical protein